jgi:hypothetical protein
VLKTVKNKIGFHSSTRIYKPIFEIYCWKDVCDDLHTFSTAGEWDQMGEFITDEILDAFAIEGWYG